MSTESHSSDVYALARLINNYHWRADHFDWVGWADSFTEDAEFDLPGTFGMMKGRQQIHDICKGNMDHVYEAMQHVMVNLDFEVGGADSATGHGNLIFTAIPDAARPHEYYQAGGRYNWKFRRTSAGWKICTARLEFLWNNGGDQSDVFAGAK
ncbi:MAG: nuclear transport factor 2 family protein [Gammaproteobacteria bacterium]